MDGRMNPFLREQEDYDYSPDYSEDSPSSGVFRDSKMASTSSPRKRRGLQKIVVSVPMKDVEGSRLKGEISTPPSDSWAWRKYGQKPIKGSPYPRAYYRCSSSKGCLARKQVERNRADPTMLMVTYSSEHNHPWPASKNSNNRNRNQTENRNQNQNRNQQNDPIAEATTTPVSVTISSPNVTTSNSDDDQISPNFVMDEEFTNFDSEFSWFSSFETTSSTLLESPILARDGIRDADIATIFSTKEGDESFFADLEELPECSLVFGRGVIGVS